MKLAFDFLNLALLTGGSEYMRRVFFECIKKIEVEEIKGIELYAIWDSSLGISFSDMTPEALKKKANITFVDIKDTPISIALKQHSIDRFFISCTMAVGMRYPDCSNIDCEVIMVSHDIYSDELYHNQINYYLKFTRPKYFFENRDEPGWKIYFRLNDSTPKLVRWLIHIRRDRVFEKTLQYMKPIVELAKNNPRVKHIAVSEYTKMTMVYNYGLNFSDIEVLGSPERVYNDISDRIENEELRSLIEQKKKFYLMVSADRTNKNPHKAVRAFLRYAQYDCEAHFVALGYEEKESNKIHNISWLSDSDLQHAYKHCYALLYPSFFEGFGYPPLEAMHYGKPVLCSNVTSMPEIYQSAPVWFSPLYESAIFQALMTLNESNYSDYCMRSEMQYSKISSRLKSDLERLINLIIS